METTTPRFLRSPLGAAGAMAILALLMGAGERDLSQCAGVDDPGARLACYDALAGRTAAPGAAAPAAPMPPVPVAVPAPNLDEFGKAPKSTAPDSMTAHVVGKFTEWKLGTLIRLDNGQVWQAIEDRSFFYPNVPENPEVEITKGVFGYRLEIKAIGRRISVKRIS
jgi:hypothetical protein